MLSSFFLYIHPSLSLSSLDNRTRPHTIMMKSRTSLLPLLSIFVTLVAVTSALDVVIPQSIFTVPAQSPYPTPLTQWIEFPDISVTRFDLGNVSVQYLLEAVAASTVFNDITWDSTLDSCPPPTGPVQGRQQQQQDTVKQDHKRKKFVLEKQDGKQSPLSFYFPFPPSYPFPALLVLLSYPHSMDILFFCFTQPHLIYLSCYIFYSTFLFYTLSFLCKNPFHHSDFWKLFFLL